MQSIASIKSDWIYLMHHDAMDYITKIETILICNNFRPNGNIAWSEVIIARWSPRMNSLRVRYSALRFSYASGNSVLFLAI